jgi:hypothetical protein
MKSIHAVGILLLVLLMSSCGNPLDKPFNRETAEADFARIVKLGLIDSTETSIMSHFMVEHDLIGAQVLELGATYEDILEESKKFWEKSGGKKKEEEGVDPKRDILANGLLKDLTVSVQPVVSSVLQSEWSHGIKYHLILENTSDKAIKAVKGNLVFFDSFGDKVYSIEYKYLDTIALKEKIEKDVLLRIQNAASPQLLLEYGKTNPFIVKWEPVSIIFN